MKRNVLVFPCGSEIGLEVNRALANSAHFNIYGVNSVDDHGKYVYKNYIEKFLCMEGDNFIDDLNEIILDHQIDFVVPAHDSANLIMAAHQNKIKAEVVTSIADTCNLCRSKGKTYQLFEKLIPTPYVYQTTEVMSFPVFLKPDSGQGSKGTFTAHSKEEVDFYLINEESLLALEYLPGKEYTIDCFTNKEGKLLFSEGRIRNRISNGISVNSKRIINEQFQKLAQIINHTLAFRGVWFFQVKERADGELVLMEISPRIAGTMALFRASGVNFILLSLFDRMGFDVSVVQNNFAIEIDRALFARYTIDIDYEYVYVDFDDTIIVNNNINTTLLMFLYQARNYDKKIVLITKHIYNIQETLNKFAISNFLFDEIIQIHQSAKKVDYIKNSNSIFIDDSFEERKAVLEGLRIPSFALDAVESLLCWKS
ncbi:5-formaminoimidazole-4-carboxamide-1-beta-D-ribofuranosyl 5'-monophosphate synthetase [Pedobacter sp. CG_S7]|uniref:ATP-grasp domain-containing protein n=1 Tax=Pedobacter sp. CG_S7 TaxID=3143930 RepID=UPI003394DBFF